MRSLARSGGATSPTTALTLENGHSSSQGVDAPFRPLPVHFRLLYAIESAFQDGLVASDAVIAKRMGGKTRRETICRWRRRNPRLMEWIRDQLAGTVLERKPFVDRRVTHLAEQGSVEHTKLYYAYVEKLGPLASESAPAPGAPAVEVHILVPRPHMPQAGLMPPPVAPVAQSSPLRPAIPMVTVR